MVICLKCWALSPKSISPLVLLLPLSPILPLCDAHANQCLWNLVVIMLSNMLRCCAKLYKLSSYFVFIHSYITYHYIHSDLFKLLHGTFVRYYFWSYMKSLFYYELHHLIMISSLHYISSSFTVLSFLKPEGLDFLTFSYPNLYMFSHTPNSDVPSLSYDFFLHQISTASWQCSIRSHITSYLI